MKSASWIGVLVAAAFVTYCLVMGHDLGPPTPISVAECISFGFLVGAYGTMVGAGGGFLIVPALLLVYHAQPSQAAGTSLTVVFFNAVSGTISYAQQKRIDYRTGLLFALATLPGAVAGAFFSRLFSGRTFTLIFAAILLGIAALLIWRPTAQRDIADAIVENAEESFWHHVRRITDYTGHQHVYHYNWVTGLGFSFLVGFFSSVLGIGGGVIHVPVMIHLLGFPAHLATATSHFILAISAGVGAGTHISLGHVIWVPAIFMAIGVVIGAQLGAVVAREMKGTRIVRLLSLALVVVAVRLLLS